MSVALAALIAPVHSQREVHTDYLRFSDWVADVMCPAVKA
jgi:hypothetical protein